MVIGAAPTGLEVADFVAGLVGAIGTIATLVLGLVLGLHEVRKLRQEANDREVEQRERAEAKRREQAEQISAIARVDSRPRPAYSLDLDPPGKTATYFGYADVINASNLPVYEAKVALPNGEGKAQVIEVGFIPPGENGHAHLPALDDHSLHGQPVVVSFRDAGSRWWRRCEEGHISEHDGDPYPRPD